MSDKHCIGISFGSDNGIVSAVSLSSQQQQTEEQQQLQQQQKELLKQPLVLCNSDGNRSSSLWLNVANDEFLTGDGARNASLRSPQNALHCIIKLLLSSKSISELAKKLQGKCVCGNNCGAFKQILARVISKQQKQKEEQQQEEKSNNNNNAADEIVVAIPVNDEEGEEKKEEKEETLNDFLLNVLRSYSFDSDGVVNPTEKQQQSGGGGGDEEKEVTLPRTTWDCALSICRVFRTIIRDSLSGGNSSAPTSPSSSATAAASSSSSSSSPGGPFPSTNPSQPSLVVVSVPRSKRIDTHVVQSLFRTAWHDWTGAKKHFLQEHNKQQQPGQKKKGGKGGGGGGGGQSGNDENDKNTKIFVVHDDVAALAASYFPIVNSLAEKEKKKKKLKAKKKQEDQNDDDDDDENLSFALCVDWGASQLTVSLLTPSLPPASARNGDSESGVQLGESEQEDSTIFTCLASRTLESEIGGQYLDQLITKELIQVATMRKKFPPVETSSRGYRKFLSAAEKAKLVLSTAMTTSIEIESAVEGLDFIDNFTRSKLEMLLTSVPMLQKMSLVQKFQNLVQEVLKEGQSKIASQKFFSSNNNNNSGGNKNIEFGIILSGGMLKIPHLQNAVKMSSTTLLEQWCSSAEMKKNLFPSSSSSSTTKQKQEGEEEGEKKGGAGGGEVFVSPSKWSHAASTSSASFAGTDPQEVVSLGACVLAQQTFLSHQDPNSCFELADQNKTDHFIRGADTVPPSSKLSFLASDVFVSINNNKASGGFLSSLNIFGSSSSNNNNTALATVFSTGTSLPASRKVELPSSSSEPLVVFVKKNSNKSEEKPSWLKFPLQQQKTEENDNKFIFYVDQDGVLSVSKDNENEDEILSLQL